MSNYAVMPKADYIAACNTIREKTGGTEVIKSGELAEKINDVYSAGQIFVLQNSKYMYPTVSGEVIRIDDMANIPHKVKVTKRSDTVEDLDAVKVKKYGKNLALATDLFQFTENYSELVEDGRNCLRFTDSAYRNSTADIPFKENTQYTFSFWAKRTLRVGEADAVNVPLRIYYTDGTSSNIVLQDSNAPMDKWVYNAFTSTQEKTILNIGTPSYTWHNWIYIDIDTFQIEEGTTVTEYEPYSMEYVGEAFDSTPNIVTLIPDTSGIILDCQYCRDIDKYIDKCFSEQQ